MTLSKVTEKKEKENSVHFDGIINHEACGRQPNCAARAG